MAEDEIPVPPAIMMKSNKYNAGGNYGVPEQQGAAKEENVFLSSEIVP